MQKVAHAQAAGAYGVVVVDTAGRCDAGFNQMCCPGADKYKGEGRLRALPFRSSFSIPYFGTHYLTHYHFK